jgi:predicted ester cyclase
MSADENKAVTRRINEEAWTNGNLDVIDEITTDQYVHTVVGAPESVRGPQGFRELVTMFRNAFPDFRVTTEEQVAEGDVVVTRWTVTGTPRAT